MMIKTTIRGLTPLLMNRFTEENEVNVSSGTRISIRANGISPREQAEAKAYLDKEGKPYIPGGNIFSCIVAAGLFHKAGRSKLTTQKSSLVPAGLTIVELLCPIECAGWEVDSRSVVIPATGGRIMAHRPRIDDWQTSFTLDVDEAMFSEKTVRLLVDDAGKRIGIGDFRPSRKGPFGRFSVTCWKTLTRGP
jgi:hypothetical protein